MKKQNPETLTAKFGKLLAIWVNIKDGKGVLLQELKRAAAIYKNQFYLHYDHSTLDKHIEKAQKDPVAAIYQSIEAETFQVAGYISGETSFNTVLVDTLSQACLQDRETVIASLQVDAIENPLNPRLSNELKFLGVFKSEVDIKANAAKISASMQEQRGLLRPGK